MTTGENHAAHYSRFPFMCDSHQPTNSVIFPLWSQSSVPLCQSYYCFYCVCAFVCFCSRLKQIAILYKFLGMARKVIVIVLKS